MAQIPIKTRRNAINETKPELRANTNWDTCGHLNDQVDFLPKSQGSPSPMKVTPRATQKPSLLPPRATNSQASTTRRLLHLKTGSPDSTPARSYTSPPEQL